MPDLFREQAVKHVTQRLDGNVLLVPSIGVWALGGFLTLTIAIGLVFASASTYTRKATVTGWLVPSDGSIRTAAVRGGTVLEILVNEGDVIDAGAPIARLGLATATHLGSSADGFLATIEDQTRAVKDRAASDEARLAADANRLKSREINLRSERAAAMALRDILTESFALIKEDEDRAESLLRRGMLSSRDAQAKKIATLQARQQLKELDQTVLLIEGRLSEVSMELSALPLLLDAARAEANSELSSLAERSARTSADSEYLVVAPVDATVEVMSARVGQTLAAGATLAALFPTGSELIAELYVPSRAIGFLQQGQNVRLKYEAFPYQRFGVGQATLQSVSQTVLAPSEVSVPGITIPEPVFRIQARLERASVDAYGEQIALRTGMLVSADIAIDERSLIQWLLDPLYAVGRR